MEADNTNEVVLIDDEDSLQSTSTEKDGPPQAEEETRPLMALFKRLISNDTKSNTILTNAQILSILIKEFDIDASNLHPLEIDIYINIVKKFLKDWPQWDVFDRTMNRLKKRGDKNDIKNTLEQKYVHLKQYLQSMINIATPLANETIKKVKDLPEGKQMPENDIVLEVYCTRKMLNSFIYKQPNIEENNSVFNLMDFEPMRLFSSSPTYSFSSLLHWYGVRLTIDLPYFQYTRYTAHRLKHVLVNQSNGTRDLNEELDTSVYMKHNPKIITNGIIITCIKNFLDEILAMYDDTIEYEMIKSIFNVIKSDLVFESMTVDVPGSYKQHLNKHPYVRKLVTEVQNAQSPHKLHIEEKIIPIQDWHIGKFVNVTTPLTMPELQNWLKFECGECKQKFNGAEFLTMLREHFKVYHIDEPDWSCVNCQNSFTISEITHRGWKHEC